MHRFTKVFVLFLTLTFVLSACSESSSLVKRNREVMGNPNASVELKIYSDLQCPACAQASDFLNVVLEKYTDKIKITYHHFPLEQIHQFAYGAAIAAECAGEQGSFWKFVKYAYKNQDQLDTKSLKKHALNLALNTDAFNTCLDNQSTVDLVKADLKESMSLRLEGTPTFAINDTVYPLGTKPEEIMSAIEKAINQTQK